jgi:hypothetical protein
VEFLISSNSARDAILHFLQLECLEYKRLGIGSQARKGRPRTSTPRKLNIFHIEYVLYLHISP